MTVPVSIERRIAASPEIVWGFVSDPDQWLAWQGTEAHLEARPGADYRVNIRGDGFATGQVVEAVPHQRISFTWGFDIVGHPLPPGSTLVTIDLIPDGEGTILRLSQAGVPDGFEAVGHGWEHYLDRLVVVAEGGDPGPDPLLITS